MEKKHAIYFWFDSPPKVGKGAFNYVANNWPEEVHYVFNNDFREERKASNWNDGDFGKAWITELFREANPDETIDKIFCENPQAIHVVNGLDSLIMRKIKKRLFSYNVPLVVLSERPVLMGGIFEKLLRKVFFQLKYRRLYHQFKSYVKAFLPLGQLGVDTFRRYGWRRDVMFPFMYNPQLTDISVLSDKDIHRRVRFLYVGRFYYKTKGIDTLMKATSFLKGDWSLDLVGGYGLNADEVIEWANTRKQVHYKGRWNSLEVTKKMQEYDVIVIPTKYDGWNLLVNEGLHAGIGVITTNEAVSHEIIEKCGAGIVVEADNPRKLAEALQFAINHPEEVSAWKHKASLFVSRISTPVVGQYMIDTINYCIYNEGIRPKCPWV